MNTAAAVAVGAAAGAVVGLAAAYVAMTLSTDDWQITW